MSFKISRILHAGYVFESSNIQIAFDPVFENPFSVNCYAYPDVKFDIEKIKKLNFSAVFISHFHDDHCSFDSLNLLNRNTPIYMYCVFNELFSMIKELGFVNVYSLKLNQPISVGPFIVTPYKALDADVDSLFQIQAAGMNVLNVVDSWIDEQTLTALIKQGPWDMVLWPFQTMREIEVIAPLRIEKYKPEIPYEWVPQLKRLNPRYIVPSSCQFIQESWSWYKYMYFPISYNYFEKQMLEILPEAKTVKLNPSVSVELNHCELTLTQPLSWIYPLGNQDVDYEYDIDYRPPKTSEVSKNFKSLNSTETDKVIEYCRNAIVQKYKSLELTDEPFFNQIRIWKLSVYNNDGGATDFIYKLEKSNIELMFNYVGSFSWLTEISFFKLHTAINLAESLSSIYIRINDVLFDEKTENEIKSVDIMSDPLIRCLYCDIEFGSYQAAQLRRIKAIKKLYSSI